MSDLIDAHLAWMAGQRYAPNTIRDRQRVLTHAQAHLPRGLDDVYPQEIADYLDGDEWATWTRYTYRSHLAGFYHHMDVEGFLTGDPMPLVPKVPRGTCRPKPVSLTELRLALQRSEEPFRTAILLAVGAGLRASEIAACKREDVSADFVHVRRGKGGKERFVETCAALWEHVCNRPPGLLIRRKYGRPVTGAWLSSRQREHWASIGLPQLHWHRFRHTFCTTMLRAGHDALVLRDLMGHASVLTTQGYAEPLAEQRRNAVSAVDALIRKAAPAGD